MSGAEEAGRSKPAHFFRRSFVRACVRVRLSYAGHTPTRHTTIRRRSSIVRPDSRAQKPSRVPPLPPPDSAGRARANPHSCMHRTNERCYRCTACPAACERKAAATKGDRHRWPQWKTVRGRGRWFEGGMAEAGRPPPPRRGRTVAPRKPRSLGRMCAQPQRLRRLRLTARQSGAAHLGSALRSIVAGL